MRGLLRLVERAETGLGRAQRILDPLAAGDIAADLQHAFGAVGVDQQPQPGPQHYLPPVLAMLAKLAFPASRGAQRAQYLVPRDGIVGTQQFGGRAMQRLLLRIAVKLRRAVTPRLHAIGDRPHDNRVVGMPDEIGVGLKRMRPPMVIRHSVQPLRPLRREGSHSGEWRGARTRRLLINAPGHGAVEAGTFPLARGPARRC